jgi:hypothetical protein
MNNYQKAIAEITELLKFHYVDESVIEKFTDIIENLENDKWFQAFSPINIPTPTSKEDIMVLNYNNPEILNEAYFAKDTDSVLSWVSDWEVPIETAFQDSWGEDWEANMDGIDYLIITP